MEKIEGRFIKDFPKLRILSTMDWVCSVALLFISATVGFSIFYGWLTGPQDPFPRVLIIIMAMAMFFRGLILPFEIMEMKINLANKAEFNNDRSGFK